MRNVVESNLAVREGKEKFYNVTDFMEVVQECKSRSSKILQLRTLREAARELKELGSALQIKWIPEN